MEINSKQFSCMPTVQAITCKNYLKNKKINVIINPVICIKSIHCIIICSIQKLILGIS